MKRERVPNSGSRKTEGATAIVRGDPGNDKIKIMNDNID